MVDIFDEVDEELRAERAQQLLKRYGGLIVAAAVLIVGAAVGWQGWRWYEARQDRAAAAEYLIATNLANATAAGSSQASRTAAIAAFAKLAATAPEGYATLSRLREAALKADAGDLQGATALWDQVAGDASADPLLRDLASLLWAQHQIDSGDPSLLEARLKALAAPGEPLACAGRGTACAAGPAAGQDGSGPHVAAPSGAGRHGAEWRSRPGKRPADPAGRLIGMARLTRRSALLAPLALGGCGLWDDWFGTHKTPLPGKREAICVRPSGSEGGRRRAEGRTADAGAQRRLAAGGRQSGAFHGPSRRRRTPDRGLECQYRRRRRLSAQDHGPAGGGGRYRLCDGFGRGGLGVRRRRRPAGLAVRYPQGGRRQHQRGRRAHGRSGHALHGQRAGRGGRTRRRQGHRALAEQFRCAHPVRPHRGGGPAVRHHHRGPPAGAGDRRRTATLVVPGRQSDDEPAGPAGARLCGRAGRGRLRFGRAGDAARRKRHPRVDRRPDNLGEQPRRGGYLRGTRAAGGERRQGLCDQRRRAGGRHRSAEWPAAVGARGGGRGQSVGGGVLAVHRVARAEDGGAEPRRRPGGLGHRSAALGEPGEAERPDHLVWASAGGRPAGGGRDEPSGAGGQSLYRRGSGPAGPVRSGVARADRGRAAPSSW